MKSDMQNVNKKNQMFCFFVEASLTGRIFIFVASRSECVSKEKLDSSVRSAAISAGVLVQDHKQTAFISHSDSIQIQRMFL